MRWVCDSGDLLYVPNSQQPKEPSPEVRSRLYQRVFFETFSYLSFRGLQRFRQLAEVPDNLSNPDPHVQPLALITTPSGTGRDQAPLSSRCLPNRHQRLSRASLSYRPSHSCSILFISDPRTTVPHKSQFSSPLPFSLRHTDCVSPTKSQHLPLWILCKYQRYGESSVPASSC